MVSPFEKARGLILEVARGNNKVTLAPYVVIRGVASMSDGRIGELKYNVPKDKLDAYRDWFSGECVEFEVEFYDKGLGTLPKVNAIRRIEGGKATLTVSGK